MQPLEVSVARHDGHDVVTLKGELDLYTHPHLRSVVLDPHVCAQPTLVVDLRDVSFMDSQGVALLVATRRWTQSRGARLALVCPENHVRKLLRMSRLDQVVPVGSDLADAITLSEDAPRG